MKILNTVVFSEIVRYYGDKVNPIRRFKTDCCALGQLSINNDHSIEEIRNVVETVKKETENKWNPNTRAGGERALFVITTMPYEDNLAQKLEYLGFEKVTEINRRNGYGPGTNIMWIIKW